MCRLLINYPALFDDHPAFAIALCGTVHLSLAFDGALTLRAGRKLPRERRVDARLWFSRSAGINMPSLDFRYWSFSETRCKSFTVPLGHKRSLM